MKFFTLKASAIAVAAVVAGQAFAAVNMDTTPTAIKYASEQTVLGTGSTLSIGAASDLTANVALGATFAANAVAYVRFDLTGGTFAGAPTVTATGPAGGVTASVSQGGAAGDSYVIMALAPSTAGEALTAAGIVSAVATNGIKVTTQGGVTLTYRLFETLTNAANQTLPLKTVSNAPFITFSPGLTYAATAAVTNPVADVNAVNGAYTDFTTIGEKAMGLVKFTATGVALQSGATSTAATILHATNSTVTVTGDFSFAASTGTVPYDTAAKARVNLDTSTTCAGAGYSAGTLSATTASYSGLTPADLTTGLTLCLVPQAASTATILASTYTGVVHPVGLTGFSLADQSAAYASITRNGGQVDIRSYIPASTVGFTSFVRVINTGSSSVAVSGQWLYEDGTTGTSAQIGSIAAGGAKTWTSTEVEAAIGAPTAIGNNRPRLRITAPSTGLEVQSFFLNGTSSFSTMHGRDGN